MIVAADIYGLVWYEYCMNGQVVMEATAVILESLNSQSASYVVEDWKQLRLLANIQLVYNFNELVLNMVNFVVLKKY